MSASVHGVGPVTAMIGGLLAFFGFITASRFNMAYDLGSEKQQNNRRGRFLLRSIPVLKRIGWIGVAVGIIGLLIWAVTAVN